MAEIDIQRGDGSIVKCDPEARTLAYYRYHGEGLDSKYLYVCHAEFNAILNTRDGAHLNGCTLYVTLFPCNECAKAIIQVGIREVVYLSDKYSEGVSFQASRKMFDMAGVKVRPYEGKTVQIAVK